MSSASKEAPITHLTCSLTGHAFTPSSDIVITPSGYTCEKRLLLSKITENGGIDPFDATQTLALSEKDLISLNATNKNKQYAVMPPRPASASSLPNLLHMLQEEYDGIMLELFDTRSALEETRKELSQALYQNDAAVRVIARLTMERDHARQKLTELSSNTSENGNTSVVEAEPEDEATSNTKKRKLDNADTDAETDDTTTPTAAEPSKGKSGIPTEHVDAMVSKWKTLSKARRKKTPPPPTHATIETFQNGFVAKDKKSLHKTSGKAGINCVSINGDWVVTGANDKCVVVYDRKENKQIGTLTGANKEITCAKALISENLIVSGAADGKVRAYTCNQNDVTNWSLLGTIALEKENNKQSPIVGLEIQPTNQYILATSKAGEIAFCVLDKSGDSISIEHVHSFHAKEGVHYTCSAIHPDGLILGTGSSSGTIELWDLRTQALVSTMNTTESESPVTSLSFSENGYQLLSSNDDGTVTVHDIRKLGSDKSTIAQLNLTDSNGYVGSHVNSVQFDPCGKFLAYGGEKAVAIVPVKEWNKVLARIEVEEGNAIQALAWNVDAKSLATVSATERVTRFWGENDKMDVNA